MKVVFVGPSLYGAEVDLTGLLVRPPAVQGDITKAVEQGATHIGLIDGAFGSVASVWHKEILYALESGVSVLGSSSMGALRSAECAAFGMVPVGEVAHAYLSGALDDDAAVALHMAPEEWGWMALTEPLVDAWSTLDALVKLGSISASEARALKLAAEELHFTERNAEAIVRSANLGRRSETILGAYNLHHVSIKQLDAVELVHALKADCGQPGLRDWRLNPSPMWADFLATHA